MIGSRTEPMEAMAEFLAMGGHGAFVWPAFGVAAVVMVALLVSSLRQARANQAALDRLQALRPPRRATRPTTETVEAGHDP